jgi:hypothetical protein
MLDEGKQNMIEGWAEKIQDAQTYLVYVIGGQEYSRVRYGEENNDWDVRHHANSQPCPDCAVAEGQFHVVNCDTEQCPACGGQVLTCECSYQGDEAGEQ